MIQDIQPKSTFTTVKASDDALWYKDAIIYELRTRSFYDSDDDGVGDLRGLTEKLDYLSDLGITAIWILPHYPSPGRDDGYDISDYTDVQVGAGTLDDFRTLVEEAHRRGIRVITELVINHTSDQHAWFQRARRALPGSPERNFYVWSDTPNRYEGARIIFRDYEPSNWTWDPVAKAYFWHRFFSHQPDLNFDNPAVQEAVLGIVDFWLQRGVDGLRLDAVPYLYEREGTNCENLPETHAFLKKLRSHIDEHYENRLLIAEANQWPEDAAHYFGYGDECHMAFHFPIMPRLFMSIQMEDRFPIIDIVRQTRKLPAICQWAMFLRNHDELTLEMVTDEERDYMYYSYAYERQTRINLGIRRRLAPLCGNDRRKMELLNALLFSMPGTPVLYYGDEIGMGDNIFLGDRNSVRTPMQWSSDRNAGFSRANPQRLDLPIIIDPEYHYEAINVETQQSNPNSLLWWTKRLVALRKQYRAFGRGTVEFLNATNPSVLAFLRRDNDQLILVVANLSRRVQYVEIDLSSMKGMVPIELMGRTRFPPIGDTPYLLTLAGYAFYWFRVEAPQGPSPGEQRRCLMTPTLSIKNPDELLSGTGRARLESILPPFLEAQGWLAGTVNRARIVDTERMENAVPAFLVFIHVEYAEGDAETFMVPLIALTYDPDLAQFVSECAPGSPGTLVANLRLQGDMGTTPSFLLVFAASEGAGRIFLDLISTGASFRTRTGTVLAEKMADVTIDPEAVREARILSSNPFAASIAYGQSLVLRLFYRNEEGTAPEIEAARLLQEKNLTGHMPRILGWVEHRALDREPITLAVLEEQIANQGTAWQQARGELDRAYERVLARPATEPAPTMPPDPLISLVNTEPPERHRELMGTYSAWAEKLGARVAGLHLALASSLDPGFEPVDYSATDQWSRYQAARSLTGQTLSALRRSLGELPTPERVAAGRVLAAEAEILSRFEPLKQTIDAKRIRIHGDLHLDRVLFTGKDFVLLGPGAAHRRRLAERKRKATALRDVASMIRSFEYAAAIALEPLRPEDHARAEPWSRIWARWASAAFLRGYLQTAGKAPFLAQ
jgi:maltose alpha-D-glucosyltransferase / alpha-amylase